MTHRFTTALLVPLVSLYCLVPTLLAAQPKKYALLIAVTQYGDGAMNTPTLLFPEDDARAMGSFLEMYGYQCEYLLGEQATKANIESKLGQLSGKSNQDGVMVLGLWGHGVEFDGGEAMFCPYDTSIHEAVDSDGKRLFKSDGSGDALIEPNPTSLVGMSRFLSGLRICGAGNRLLLADCCRVKPNAARGRGAFGSKITAADLPPGTAAIFACAADQKAFEHDNWKHGALTKAMLDELQSIAGRDNSRVSDIIGKVSDSVSLMVSTITRGREQQTIHPIMNGLPSLRLTRDPVPKSINDLLRFGAIGIKKIEIDAYTAVLEEGNQLTLERNYTAKVSMDGPEWKLVELLEFAGDNPMADPRIVSIPAEAELNTSKVNEMKISLDELIVVDLIRKPASMSESVRSKNELVSDAEAVRSLVAHGFFPLSVSGNSKVEIKILATNGELAVGLSDGVEYILRFGGVLGVHDENDEESKNAGALNRYLLVTAQVDESHFPPPDLTSLPRTIEELHTYEKNEATKSQAAIPPRPGIPLATMEGNRNRLDAELKRLEAEQKRITQENQRAIDERKNKIVAAERRVQELNIRLADWYFVISEDTCRKLRIHRDELTK